MTIKYDPADVLIRYMALILRIFSGFSGQENSVVKGIRLSSHKRSMREGRHTI